MSEFTIRPMLADELKIAIDWAAREGWNPGLNDAELFYLADPNGFFVGELNGEIVAVGSAVTYDHTYAFCGLYIVAPEHRGKGYGLTLTKHRLANCGDRNVGIDGVLENVEIYKRIGYVPYYQNKRFQKLANATTRSAHVVDITKEHIPHILTYDKPCFGATREQFLAAWLLQPQGKSVCFLQNGEIKGYAVRRKCQQGYKVGPLFADSPDIALSLFQALQVDIQGEQIILDVPENNPQAISLAESERMDVVFATMRMYQKTIPATARDKIYGITTFELG